MMKKVVSSVLMLSIVAAMLLGLVGCGDKTVENPPVDTPPVVETPVEPPVDTPPVEDPVEIVVSTDDIVNTMMNTFGEYYLPTMPLDAEMFNMQLGIEADKASEYYSEFYAGMPMIGFHADRLFVAKTNDVNKMTEVFKNYMDIQIEDGHQYPSNLSKLENYVITTQGDYVILFILGGYTDEVPTVTEGKTEEQIAAEQEAINVAYYKAQNEKALNALTDLFANGYTAPVVDETTTPVEGETVTDETTTPVEGETVTDESAAPVEGETTPVEGEVANEGSTATGENAEAPSGESGAGSSDTTNNQ